MAKRQHSLETAADPCGHAANSVYGPDYYARSCGPIPYDRTEEHWSRFFGNVADQLIRSFNPRRVFDAGCAHGFLVEALWDRGVEAYGCDTSVFAISQVRADVRSFCTVASIADSLDGSYDLVTCIEVLEHMPEAEARRAIANLAGMTSTIVFSSSPTDLDEPTHINVRPTIYWLQAFAEQSFAPLPNFDATFIAPHCFVLRKSSMSPSEDELHAFADCVRLRVRCSELEQTVGRLTSETTDLHHAVDKARADLAQALSAAEAARIAGQEAFAQAEAFSAHERALRVRAEADLAQALSAAEAARTAGQEALAQAEAFSAHERALRVRAEADLAQALSAAEAARTAGQEALSAAERSVDAIRQDAEHRVACAVAERELLSHTALLAEQRAVAIEGSTVWRATRPLRRLLDRFPKARRTARRTLHGAWWIMTFQLPRRLRERRVQQAQIRTVAASPLFERDWYLEHYPDVAAAGVDPALHYALHGAVERRSPGPNFDAAWYLSTYPDVAASGVNPLLHYIEYGIAEGRYATPPVEAEHVDPYTQWVREYDTLDDADRAAIRAQIATLVRRPLISIVVPVYDTEEIYLREMLESVLQQLYPHWELCLADDASTRPHVEQVLRELARRDARIKVMRRQINGHICAATNSALELATGEFVALLDHDDLLSERALYEVALEINAHPDADVVYSDSDQIDDSGRRWEPYFKTDWDADLMLGHNMVSHLGVYRRALVEHIGRLRVGFEGSQDYDLMLRAAEATTPDRIRHVPAILYHWRRNARPASFSDVSLDRCVAAARRATRSHLERTGIRARVEAAPRTRSYTRVIYALPDERPLVSVIVPTRDRADLLARCADGVLTRTDYEPLELIIVDNDSQEPDTHQLLARLAADPRVRIMRHPGDFNYAAINNRAVQEARGALVVLLNNDVDVIASWWLEEMVSHALRPEVGAVGAKLLYPDGRVQHAGVVLGVGHGAGHFFHLAPRDDVGYFGFLALTRRVSAVTAACMVLRRSVYLDAGGLDADHFPVAFNDVDLCLRIGARGYAIVWTPHAELYHLESATRGTDLGAEPATRLEQDAAHLRRRWGAVLGCDPDYERDRIAADAPDGEQLQRRWRAILSCDPYYNPNCSILAAYFEPGFPPRRPKPWLSFEGRTTEAPAVMSLADTLLGSLDRSARIIEIGPSFSPIAPKADGWNTTTLDHTTRAHLVEKYRGEPEVDVDRIEEVDFIWTKGSVADTVPSELHGTFDVFIASHVIEHTTDLVGFLDAAATLLAPSGVVILVVPDKRYCFDYFRPLTTTGEVLDAHAAGRSRHTRRVGFDFVAYFVKNGGSHAWGQTPTQRLQFVNSLEQAGEMFSTLSEDQDAPYVDLHAWQFSPASFELLLLELARLGETDWQVERITPPTGCEFYVWLRRGGKAAAAALTVAEVNARRLALLQRSLLQTREQIDLLLAGEPELELRLANQHGVH